MSSPKRFRVAICGGGIGGLTCALALSQYGDIDVDIYEGASRFAEVGAGFGLWPRPWRVMQLLGLDHDLLEITEGKLTNSPVDSFRYRKSDQSQGLSFFTLRTIGNLLPFHRAEFQKILLKKLPKSCHTYCAKRFRSYTQRSSGGIELHFEDGSKAYCDVLVGADGLKSAVRGSLLKEKSRLAESQGRLKEASDIHACIEPVWSGALAYRALIPADRLRARAPNHPVFKQPTQYLGKNAFVIAYPISHGRMINFVAFTMRHDLENTKYHGPWASVVEKEEFSSQFRHWEPVVQELIDCVEKPMKWVIHTVRPMGSYVSGRVVLLGDAAHAMTPHQGSGAGQAIEDAYILATLLGHPRTTRDSIHRALQVYDKIRRPAAAKVVEKSRLNGQYFTFHIHGFDDRSTGDKLWHQLQKLGQTFTKNWEWTWTTSFDSSVQEAVRML